MRKEDLAQKLENTETPDIKLPGHQHRLKTALLENGYIYRKRSFPETIRIGLNAVTRTLASRQPVWQTGLIVSAVAVILSILVPLMNTDSVYAKAREIVKDARDIKEMLNKSDNQSISSYTISVSNEGGTAVLTENGVIIAGFDIDGVISGEIQIGKFNSNGEAMEFLPADAEKLTLIVEKDGVSRIIDIILDKFSRE